MQKDNIITVLVSVILSVVVSVALCATVSGSNPAPAASASAQDMNKTIEDYLMNNPTKVREALVLAEQKEQEEAERRIAELYKSNWKDLSSYEGSPYVGPKDADIVIVEFFDFNCGYCKRLAPELMKVIKNNPDVKVVFKPVTFLGSMPIAKAAMAANKQGKFLEVYEALLSHNGQITTSVIDDIIKKAGLDVAKTKKLMDSSEIAEEIADIAELSQKVQIRGVPTLIINGEALPAIDSASIQNAIDKLK